MIESDTPPNPALALPFHFPGSQYQGASPRRLRVLCEFFFASSVLNSLSSP
jgi:hypothetical protein